MSWQLSIRTSSLSQYLWVLNKQSVQMEVKIFKSFHHPSCTSLFEKFCLRSEDSLLMTNILLKQLAVRNFRFSMLIVVRFLRGKIFFSWLGAGTYEIKKYMDMSHDSYVKLIFLNWHSLQFRSVVSMLQTGRWGMVIDWGTARWVLSWDWCSKWSVFLLAVFFHPS